ncbi:hypothetical protein [Amaricoccus sp. W119]|uniref:hypothetical protein n=1 Tax=Amaricoccus sp. W119 TaxID=3391833 RepID=UPI0039A70CE2
MAWFGYRTTGDQSRGTIKGVGAIDVEDARDAIKKIMEGGEQSKGQGARRDGGPDPVTFRI